MKKKIYIYIYIIELEYINIENMLAYPLIKKYFIKYKYQNLIVKSSTQYLNFVN